MLTTNEYRTGVGAHACGGLSSRCGPPKLQIMLVAGPQPKRFQGLPENLEALFLAAINDSSGFRLNN
jgi:hypothetical protein